MIQIASPLDESVDARRARVAQMVAGAKGSDLVVLPELWAAGYFAFDEYPTRAEPADGPTVQAAKGWARDLGCYVQAGSYVERDEDGRLHNTTALVSSRGEVIHTYRKVHVFGYESREAELLTAGESVSSVDSPFGVLGATTCYDLRFPEIWRGLVDVGCEIAIVPAAWPAARLAHWRLFTAARAVENQMLVIACNAVGMQGDVVLGGHSRVVDPWGEVLVEAGNDEGIVTVDVDPGIISRVRLEFSVLSDRYSGFAADGSQAHAVSRVTTIEGER